MNIINMSILIKNIEERKIINKYLTRNKIFIENMGYT